MNELTIKDMKFSLDWDVLSRRRTELMGMAMIAIMLFHMGNPRTDMFYGLRRCGNVGVDMFLFMSGIGLWFSWQKRPEYRHFFRNRYWRVYPSWLVMATIYYLPRYLSGGHRYTQDLADLFSNILFNGSFWFSGDLAFWYVPATMLLYCFAPAYMNLIRRYPSLRWLPALMMVWCVAVQWVAPVHDAVRHLEIFWSRIPIFLLGLNCGEAVRSKWRCDGASGWFALVVFVASFGLCIYLEQQLHGRFPIFIERLVYIPLTISSLLLLGILLDRTAPVVRRGLAFVGTISLEIYLIHLHWVEMPLMKYRLGYWPTALLVMVISFPLAWLLYRTVLLFKSVVTRPRESGDGNSAAV